MQSDPQSHLNSQALYVDVYVYDKEYNEYGFKKYKLRMYFSR